MVVCQSDIPFVLMVVFQQDIPFILMAVCHSDILFGIDGSVSVRYTFLY